MLNRDKAYDYLIDKMSDDQREAFDKIREDLKEKNIKNKSEFVNCILDIRKQFKDKGFTTKDLFYLVYLFASIKKELNDEIEKLGDKLVEKLELAAIGPKKDKETKSIDESDQKTTSKVDAKQQSTETADQKRSSSTKISVSLPVTTPLNESSLSPPPLTPSLTRGDITINKTATPQSILPPQPSIPAPVVNTHESKRMPSASTFTDTTTSARAARFFSSVPRTPAAPAVQNEVILGGGLFAWPMSSSTPPQGGSLDVPQLVQPKFIYLPPSSPPPPILIPGSTLAQPRLERPEREILLQQQSPPIKIKSAVDPAHPKIGDMLGFHMKNITHLSVTLVDPVTRARYIVQGPEALHLPVPLTQQNANAGEPLPKMMIRKGKL